MRPPTYRFGEFELAPASRELRCRGERVALPPKSFECLAYLLAHRDRAVGRDELISAVWGRIDISDTVVAQTLLRARKALGDTGNQQRLVRTVPRFGYQWIAPVDVLPRADADHDALAPAATPLDVAGAPVPGPPPEAAIPPRRWPRRVRPWHVAVVVVAFAGIAALILLRPQQAPTPQLATTAMANAGVLVLPVRLASGDGDDAWVRLGAMDYVASRIRRSGHKVLPSEQAMHLDAQIGDHAAVSAAQSHRLAELSGARWIVAPQAERDSRGWRVRLDVSDESGQHLIEARGNSPLAAAAIATDSWLRRLDPDRARNDVGPSALDQRLQQVDAELLAGQLTAARRLIASETPQERAEPGLRVREGQLDFRSGRIDQAAAIFHALLDPDGTHDAEIRAKASMGLGAVDIRRGEFAQAEQRYSAALDVLRKATDIADPSLVGNAYNGLGVAQVQQGKMADAVRNMGRARIAMQRSGNLIEAASVGTNLGMIERQRAHHAQALQEFDSAIGVFERFQVRDYMAAALMAKADTQLDMVQAATAAASAPAHWPDRSRTACSPRASPW